MQNKKTDRGGYLSSIISLCAEQRTSVAKAMATLSCYPNIKKVSEGSTPSYLVNIDGVYDRFYIVKICKDRIVVTLNSRSSPLYFIKEHILRSLSIIMVLSDDYKVDMSGLIPYVVEALNRELVPVISKQECDPVAATHDTILSKRIVSLLNERSELNQKVAKSNALSTSLISKFILQKYASGYDIRRIASELNVNKDSVSESLHYLEKMGYRMLLGKEGTFEMVKI
ncbi:MAG: hypothetical protein M1569_04005 [Candidatus Marsarchaeota archaeon]|nr:hypothetical protein [Candidatus Marsarchaeota archaeon]MCL5413536.1 hypothetical protein [Candidatus Marsarchaeota archaeon]